MWLTILILITRHASKVRLPIHVTIANLAKLKESDSLAALKSQVREFLQSGSRDLHWSHEKNESNTPGPFTILDGIAGHFPGLLG